jgi:cytosine/adenosine deaminase-related metal-dependent hydrolase
MAKDWLIKGGRILPIAGGPKEIAADILVRDGRIVAIAPNIAADAPTIDAVGAIVLPGFVDTHRHIWQTQLRTVATDWSLWDYFVQMRLSYSTFYTAEDAYLGNFVGVLEGLDAGITTVVDHCHITNTPEHGQEALRGIQEAGSRGVFCYGTFVNVPRIPIDVPSAPAWRHDAARALRRSHLADDHGLVRFGFAPSEAETMPYEQFVAELLLARELGAAAVSCHIRLGAYDFHVPFVERLSSDGLLGPDLLFVHGAAFSDLELDLIRDFGAAICATPETELQMGMGFPVAHRASARGVKVGLGVDIVSNFPGDMFMPMRLGLQSTRAVANDEAGRQGRIPLTITPDAFSVLRMATLGGAEAIGMDSEIGSLEVGKRADIAIIRTDAMHLTPAFDAIGAVVMNARPSDIDTVLVDGAAVKRAGRLVGVDWPRLRQKFLSSAERIREGFLTLDRSEIYSIPAPRGANELLASAQSRSTEA